MLRALRSCLHALVVGACLLAPSILSVVECHARGGPVYVRGYVRKDGTYVQPHMRSAPDGNFRNNWSTVGNVNPYTGAAGTKTVPPTGYGQDVYVRGYYRADGAYVPAHYRSAPDGDASNNWSTVGNVNPYTGVAGTRPLPPDPTIDLLGSDSDGESSDLSSEDDADVLPDDEGDVDSDDEATAEPATGSTYASPARTSWPPVLALQAALSVSGQNPGTLDGILGPRTLAALRQFARENSLEALPVGTVLSELSWSVRPRLPDASVALDNLARKVQEASARTVH